MRLETGKMPNEHSLSLERLREALRYDPETGLLTWLIPGDANGGGGRRWVGKTAGSLKPSGYVCINLDRTRYRAHRLAWMLMTGSPPPDHIDHINGDRSDNRWANLRVATYQQNAANMVRAKRTDIPKGVHVYRNDRLGTVRYRAHIMVNRKTIYLGSFRHVDDASDAYAKAAKHYFGEFARVA